MKRTIALYIVFSVLLHSIGQTVIYTHYLLNKNYYATVLCINKAKPEMCCNGNCHLVKEMKAQEEKDQTPVSPLKEKQETLQYWNSAESFSFQQAEKSQEFCSTFIMTELPPVYFSVFHPPTI